jgi:hypothetical protein
MSNMPVREGVQSKTEILRTLALSTEALAAWIESQPNERFTWGPEGRWTIGQHLDHMIRSVKPLTLGLRLPKVMVGAFVGRANRPSRPYAEVVAKYEGALDAGGKAMGKYVPPAVPLAQREKLLARHRAECAKLIELLGSYSEADLDYYAAPHPLIGMLTMRELLFFTIHHHDHHLHTLQTLYTR